MCLAMTQAGGPASIQGDLGSCSLLPDLGVSIFGKQMPLNPIMLLPLRLQEVASPSGIEGFPTVPS
jgi:hypothetical protein